ncbi:MAG: thiamine pyrophosphate-binding protein [Myxococcales bacterium]|nr:thiamine pyrophosphate-binding protein [Myxococcales bacterium]
MNRSYLLPNDLFLREFRTQRPQPTPEGSAVQPRAATPLDRGEVSLSGYLNARLKQIGVSHVMAIPGDYISEWVESLDSKIDNPGADPLVRVHPNNEMCATYAADGYARVTGGTGVGCVAFTYGVGALNAVQAVAGAGVESVPLVAINGSPSQAQFNSQRDQGVLWHHMFDGSYTDLRIFQEITEMAVRIDNPAYAADIIDAALTACITARKPVYIEIANTTEAYSIPNAVQRLQSRLVPTPLPPDARAVEDAVEMVWKSLQRAEKLVLLGGVEVARYKLQEPFARLNELLGAPYLSSLLGKGILSEHTAPNFAGTYNGLNSQQNVQDLIKQADTILALGVQETDFNFSGVASQDFNPDDYPGLPVNFAIEARMGAVRINSGVSQVETGELYWGNVTLEQLIDGLTKKLTSAEGKKIWASKRFPGLAGSVWDIPAPSTYAPQAQVTWDSFKSLLQHEYLDRFQDDDAPVVLADTGLTFYGLNNIKVPQNGYVAQLAWGAIGYSPAASYGVKLALDASGQQKRRVVSISGDGAFAQSANSIGTIAELGLDNVIFVMANGVFAIEQFLIDAHAFGPEGQTKFKALTQVPQTALWNWEKLAEGLGGVGREVTTNAELSAVLAELLEGPPDPRTPTGPCTERSTDEGCCDFEPSLAPATRASTFTLIAVRNRCDDIPSNTRWKVERK